MKEQKERNLQQRSFLEGDGEVDIIQPITQHLKQVIHILLVTPSPSSFQECLNVFRNDNRFCVFFAETSCKALVAAKTEKVDAVIVDEELDDATGLDCVRDFVMNYPMVNCALVSMLYPTEFLNETEGLGVFMQLTDTPGADEAIEVVHHLEKLSLVFEQNQNGCVC